MEYVIAFFVGYGIMSLIIDIIKIITKIISIKSLDNR